MFHFLIFLKINRILCHNEVYKMRNKLLMIQLQTQSGHGCLNFEYSTHPGDAPHQMDELFKKLPISNS